MNILFHTISVEPARWTPQRVSQKLSDLLPKIAGKGFKKLEIYEPHLTAGDEEEIKGLLADHTLEAVVLSSYLQVAPGKTDDEKFASEKSTLVARVKRFGFKKVRLFPGAGVSPTDEAATGIVADRVSQIAKELPQTKILLETHDGSIADDAEAIAALVRRMNLPNVELLFQPTVFQAEAALRQFAVQKELIRHVHLQNRNPDGSFSTLHAGVVPWEKILSQLNVDFTLEFVPSGICAVEKFDLETSLNEAVMEAEYVQAASGRQIAS